MELWQDIRYAARRMLEARWFTLAAVAALAIGIGANTTGFTIVNAVLLRGLPFDDPDRIVSIWNVVQESGGQTGVSFPDMEDIRRRTRTLTHIAGVVGAPVNVADDDRDAERIDGEYVSAGFFDLLGVQPILGRGFTVDDDVPGAEPVTVIGYSVWQNRFGGRRDVIGQTVRANSLLVTIVGVMPEGMRFLDNVDIWIPKTNLPPESEVENRGTRRSAIGRLAPGVTIGQAREDLRSISRALADEYPETNAGLVPNLLDFNTRFNQDEITVIFGLLMGSVIFVLLIACANVANLMLAKSADRTREIAVRVSLGATRARIVRQLLVESLMIAALAGVAGFFLGIWGVRWFDGVTQNVGKPYWMVFSVDPVVFVYIAAVCLGTAIIFGLAPALRVSKTDVNDVLKEGTRGGSGGLTSRRWANAFVIGEVVLTVVLLSGAAFFTRSFMNMYTMETGFETDGLLTMQIYLPLTKYPEADQQLAIHRNLLDRLEGAPGIEARALTSALPIGGGGQTRVEIDGHVAEPGDPPVLSSVVTVSDGYFATLGLPLVQGRSFTRSDGEPGNETVIVNERFVQVHLSNGDALGRQVRLGAGPNADPAEGWLTVIGVVPNVRQTAIEETETDPVAYVPLPGRQARTVALMVRARGDQAEVVSGVRRTLRAVEPDLPVYDIATMDDRLAQARWGFRVFGIMFSVFAGAALLLSGVGLYSITAQSVIQRTREFGIRISLGAEPHEISRLAVRRVALQLAIGIPIGLSGAWGVGNLLEGLLVQISAGDPVILIGIAALLIGIAVVACLVPARRAASVDPVAALRVE